MKVKDIMTRDVATVGQRASLKQVARVMTDRGVSVPVVNAENHVLGVVTEGDILAKAASHPESLGMLEASFAFQPSTSVTARPRRRARR